jgi:hypothetical protein
MGKIIFQLGNNFKHLNGILLVQNEYNNKIKLQNKNGITLCEHEHELKYIKNFISSMKEIYKNACPICNLFMISAKNDNKQEEENKSNKKQKLTNNWIEDHIFSEYGQNYFNQIPEHLQIEIILQLPINSIQRFCKVSNKICTKEFVWRILISDFEQYIDIDSLKKKII